MATVPRRGPEGPRSSEIPGFKKGAANFFASLAGRSRVDKKQLGNRQMGVEPKIGGVYPPKWMVKIMENPMNKWMIWGVNTPIFGNPQMDG